MPLILTPKHFFSVSAICLDRSDLTCTCFSGRFLVQSVVERLVLPRLLPGKQFDNLFRSEIYCIAGGGGGGGGGETCFRIEAYETCF